MGHSPRQRSWSPVSGYGSARRCKRRSNGPSAVPIPCLARRQRSRFGRFSSLRTSAALEAANQEKNMRYFCLGYIEEKKWDTMSESERNAMLDECFAYDDLLRKNGHFAGGEALQSARNAITLRWQGGKLSITDGPYAETKEQLGGILVLEATDLNHAIQLMSKHPGVKAGPFEIRPAADLTDMIGESERRRAGTKADHR